MYINYNPDYDFYTIFPRSEDLSDNILDRRKSVKGFFWGGGGGGGGGGG